MVNVSHSKVSFLTCAGESCNDSALGYSVIGVDIQGFWSFSFCFLLIPS